MVKQTACALAFEQAVRDYCVANALFAPSHIVAEGADVSQASELSAEPLQTVCIAVSGGADSMALLRVMIALAEELQIVVKACHVNHCLRGAAADADQAFVQAECDKLNVPLQIFNAVKCGDLPPENAGETWARMLRYRYFAECAERERAIVAIAHTVNDQAETLLFRLARGTGAHGAAGIRPKRECYVRPLLCVSRTEVEAYCDAIGQAYIIDETNKEDGYARNHLRLHAMPSLCYANEAAVQHLGQFCEKMAQVDDYFARCAGALLADAAVEVAADGAEDNAWLLSVLLAADSLVLETAMYQLTWPLRDAEQKYAVALCDLVRAGSGAVQITSAVRFVAQAGCLRKLFGETQRVIPPRELVEFYPVNEGEYTFPSGYRVKIEKIMTKNMEKIHLVHKKDLKNYADCDKIVSSLRLRCRAQGDTFAPAGRGVTKTVKKLHNELGVPEAQRGHVPLLADGHTVVWLWGQGFAEGYAPTEQTTQVVKIIEEKIAEE